MRILANSHPRRPIVRRLHSPQAGFSLVELLVCIAIIAIISGVILARYRSFNSTLLLRDLAYEIALSTREAQVFGISVHGESGSFSDAYGMHFTTGTAYTLFTDVNDNNRYDGGEQISSYTIGQNNQIRDLCANTTCGLTSLDVLFRRPEPDSIFYTPGVSSVTSVRVLVGSIDNTIPNTRAVRVWPTGQISVE
jgi:prepilin-type N-terminal cleavage/methylation domain-containing protein